MERKTYDLKGNLSSKRYADLIKFASDYCDSFLLVTRETIELNQNANAVLDTLTPFLISRSNESQWPGTTLLNSTAKVLRYRLDPKSIEVLEHSAPSLFSWAQPDLPEDLCLIRSDGEPFLVTIAHEEDGYLVISDEEASRLETRVPGACLNLK